nr:MAG TPA: hypothetical protein [Caudoviricetes sp.]
MMCDCCCKFYRIYLRNRSVYAYSTSICYILCISFWVIPITTRCIHLEVLSNCFSIITRFRTSLIKFDFFYQSIKPIFRCSKLCKTSIIFTNNIPKIHIFNIPRIVIS